MVKFTASGNGKTVIGVGLSHENLRRVRAGQPIHVKFADLGFTGAVGACELLLFTGEDETSLREALAPFISPETVVHEG